MEWSEPVELATGRQSDGKRFPCWNPVLFQPREGDLMLFYKVGPSPSKWWGLLRTSSDAGLTWTEPRRLPEGILGPIKNKPVQLADGTILCPSSAEDHPGSPSWRVHMELSSDSGVTWKRIPVDPGPQKPDAIQPSILLHPDGRLQAVGRTRSKRVFESWSSDQGRSWTPLALTSLPNPNAGTDAVTLRDGRHLLVYNPTERGRSPLHVAISADGRSWFTALVLEDEAGAEFSYPAIIQAADGRVHVTYTWKRKRIRHVEIDPGKLMPGADAAAPR
jgi:predicted neuraminidase